MTEKRERQTGVVTDWRERLDAVVETMREMSSHRDPQEMVRAYGARMERLVHRDRLVALSRRGHEHPEFRVTRDSAWTESPDPWRQRDQLPVLRGGLLAELIYGDEPRMIDDLQIAPNDPGVPYVSGQRSLVAIPLYDQGVSLNMVLLMRRDPGAYSVEEFPDLVWMSNLFGRATHNLVLSDEVRRAYEAVDRELQDVATIQRSLLPAELPAIPNMDLAVHYETSRRAGGDYYDFFPLAEGRWGILIADVSGHGTPAAVLMAITHAMAHTQPDVLFPPGALLTRLNHQLATHYTHRTPKFVTAFYGVYEPATRELTYASAGHPSPRLKRCKDGTLGVIDAVQGLPLGVVADERYEERTHTLHPGDQIVLYTDGITEAFNADDEMFGTARLDEALTVCRWSAAPLAEEVLAAVNAFTHGRPADDDRTLVIARIS